MTRETRPAAAFLAVAALSSLIPTFGDTPADARGRDVDPSIARALLDAHNRARVEAKLAPLALDPKLAAAALVQAKDMAEHQKMTHDGSDGSTFSERIKRQGYRSRSAAENVAYGQESVKAVMKSWMESPHHKENILGSYTQAGFAYALDEDGRRYWAAEFATPWPQLDPAESAKGVIDALNEVRAENDLAPLQANPKLTEAAGWAAETLAAADPSKPRALTGDEIVAKVKSLGYRYRALAESSAAGQTRADEVAKSWVGTPAHKANILGEFTEVGVSVAGSGDGVTHWVLILARPLRD